MPKTIKSELLPIFPKKWENALKPYWSEESQHDLKVKIQGHYDTDIIYPQIHNIWKAFSLTPPNEVRVVLLGQDPYHGKGQAHGLSFSVGDDVKIPPSLKNIFKLNSLETGCREPKNGNLIKWAEQGVLLLNSSLSVKKDEPGSHSHLPYHLMLNAIFRYLNTSRNRVVFWLLGNQAQAHSSIITNTNHLCLKTSHPSPLSAYRGFHESRLFSKTDDFFKKEELNIINWCLES